MHLYTKMLSAKSQTSPQLIMSLTEPFSPLGKGCTITTRLLLALKPAGLELIYESLQDQCSTYTNQSTISLAVYFTHSYETKEHSIS